MSVQQFFNEVEAVCRVLSEYVERYSPNGSEPPPRPELEEEFTAIWQAVELLSRAHAVLVPMVQAEQSKVALVLPDPVEKKSDLIVPGSQIEQMTDPYGKDFK